MVTRMHFSLMLPVNFMSFSFLKEKFRFCFKPYLSSYSTLDRDRRYVSTLKVPPEWM